MKNLNTKKNWTPFSQPAIQIFYSTFELLYVLHSKINIHFTKKQIFFKLTQRGHVHDFLKASMGTGLITSSGKLTSFSTIHLKSLKINALKAHI